jgi:hypothetical protein
MGHQVSHDARVLAKGAQQPVGGVLERAGDATGSIKSVATLIDETSVR